MLLAEGIGDTIRVSLTRDPVEEVRVGFEILKALDIRRRGPEIIACPTCGRTEIDVAQLAAEVEELVADVTEKVSMAVMGCVVNGPGESKFANIGISLPGTGERPVAPVYEDGKKTVTLKGDHIADEFEALIDAYVERTYTKRSG